MAAILDGLGGTTHDAFKVGEHRIKSYADFVAFEGRYGTALLEVAADAYKVMGLEFSVGTQPPTSGAHSRGDVVWNSQATEDLPGWICVQSGTPGEWAPLGKASIDNRIRYVTMDSELTLTPDGESIYHLDPNLAPRTVVIDKTQSREYRVLNTNGNYPIYIMDMGALVGELSTAQGQLAAYVSYSGGTVRFTPIDGATAPPELTELNGGSY